MVTTGTELVPVVCAKRFPPHIKNANDKAKNRPRRPSKRIVFIHKPFPCNGSAQRTPDRRIALSYACLGPRQVLRPVLRPASSVPICFRSAGLRSAAAWIAWGCAAAHRAALLNLGHCRPVGKADLPPYRSALHPSGQKSMPIPGPIQNSRTNNPPLCETLGGRLLDACPDIQCRGSCSMFPFSPTKKKPPRSPGAAVLNPI